jgi:hypothetical protein
VRKQISWWLRGRAHTQAALDDHAEAIRDLQHRVDELATVVARVDPVATRADANIGALPTELRAAVDDLSSRIGRLSERLDEVQR